jgi:hypothetical protein
MAKRISFPLAIVMTTSPSRTIAERALSIKVLMPPLDNKCPVQRCKLFSFCQFTDFQSVRFAQLHDSFHIKHSFPAAKSHMNVDRPVIVAIKEKPVPVLLKDLWHAMRVDRRDEDYQ